MKTDFARALEKYLTRGGRTVISAPNDSGNIMLISPDQVGLPAGTPLRDTFQVNGLGSASYSCRFRHSNDLVARLDPQDRIIEINPNLPADDEARGRVKVDAVYAGGGPAVGVAAVGALTAGVESYLAAKRPTYAPGDIVVTAGGTGDKVGKVVELMAERHTPAGVLFGKGLKTGGVWNLDGSIKRSGDDTAKAQGKILRLATPEEAKAGRVSEGWSPSPTVPGAEERYATEGGHPVLQRRVAKLQREINRTESAVTERLASGFVPPTKRKHGWAGNTLWKGRKLKTYAPQQLMGIAARAMEKAQETSRELDGYKAYKEVSDKAKLDVIAESIHHKGQAEFLAKEVDMLVGKLAAETVRSRRRGYGWLWTAALLGLAVATWAIVYLPAPSWVPGWMLR